jgi:hypothetical protein
MSCGEELVLIADKPHPTGAPVPRTSLRTQTC